MPWGFYVFISPCFVFPFYFFLETHQKILMKFHCHNISLSFSSGHICMPKVMKTVSSSPLKTHCIWNYFNYFTCQRQQLPESHKPPKWVIQGGGGGTVREVEWWNTRCKRTCTSFMMVNITNVTINTINHFKI